ncbi:amino acid ABC transporter permease [Treponema endosymbiont of Eucomonympha sp.]|uniref:amino acid ABC transporter permease n=1 Tax=Treponema endosymbiont of Eucomonympha sp. TaxID=1580831 RepID=UPI000750C360|nr:amino acid ABC transporter permease [Treponema endosymbiont of Eucomonympha sp.]
MYGFKFGVFLSDLPKIMRAMPVTLLLTVSALAFGLALGALLCVARMGKRAALRRIGDAYVAFIRGVPQLVLIFLLYLGLPQLLKGIGVDMTSIDKHIYLTGIFAIALSAPISELMRSAYLAVDKSQMEAALSVGMKRFAAFRRIIFPQAFGIALPSLGNQVILAFKLTALAFSIGVADLMGRARIISAQGHGTRRLESYLAVALIYWGICVLLEQANRALVRRYSRRVRQCA